MCASPSHKMGEVGRQPLGWRVDGDAYLKRIVLQTRTPIVTRCLWHLVTFPPLRGGELMLAILGTRHPKL